MGRASEHDWDTLEREYITGDDTYRQLAKKRGVGKESLKWHGTKNHWWDKRKKWRHDCLKRGLQRDAKKKADAISAFQLAQIEAIEVLVEEVDAVINELRDARDDGSLTLSRRVSLIFQTAQAQRAIVKTSHLLTGQATEITRSLDTYRDLLKECGIKPNEMSGAQRDDTGGDSAAAATETLDREGSP